MRREPPLLLRQIVGIAPARHRRVSPFLGRFLRKVRIGAVVGRIPTEQHPRIALGFADLHQVVERHARLVKERGIRRDPLLRVESMRVWLKGFKHIPRSVAVDLVVPHEAAGLAMRADDVAGRQDFQIAASVSAFDDIPLDPQVIFEERIRLDDLLGQPERIGGLVFIVRDQATVGVVARGRFAQETMRPLEDHVQRLAVLLSSSREQQVVDEPSELIELLEQLKQPAAVGLDVRQQRAAVEPPKPGEQVKRSQARHELRLRPSREHGQ
jgi:hypothetical protein